MIKHLFLILCFSVLLGACKKQEIDASTKAKSTEAALPKDPYIVVLGVAQDAGYPQINCQKACCQRVYETPALARMVSSLAIVDPVHNQSWIFDASPDLKEQLQLLVPHLKHKTLPDGIFLTHGHMGHYTGLMELGREAMNASQMPVYAMPRMQTYLENNGPWSQLVDLKNISIKALESKQTITLNENISVEAFLVPHRDEFTETVGYLIQMNSKKIMFIPDIDKWSKWEERIEDLIPQIDLAFLDATFFKNGEIDRDMNQVPHPFVEESMALFKPLPASDKAKIYFTHFNHTNPLLLKDSEEQQLLKAAGFKVAEQGMIISLDP